MAQWQRDGLPANPGGWDVAVARCRALDHLRREGARAGRERKAVEEWAAAQRDGSPVAGDDQLALLFACCHPALDPASRVTLTLRVVCGLPTASIARLLLLSEAAVAQRIVRAKRKIRDAGIRLRVPDPGERPGRLASVLRAIYLTFTEGHSPHGTSAAVRDDLCEEALRLARRLHRLLPDEPEVTGLLALILLTSARSAARADEDGVPVLLTDQNRSLWDGGRLAEGQALVETALAQRGPGPTSCRPPSPPAMRTRRQSPALTGGRSPRCIASCYGSTRHQSSRQTAPSPSRMPKGRRPGWQSSTRSRPAPGSHAGHGCTSVAARCSPQCDRPEDAVAEYQDALALEPADAVRRHITAQIAALGAAHAPTEEN